MSYPDPVTKATCDDCQRDFYHHCGIEHCPYCGSTAVYSNGNGVVRHD